MKTPDSHHKAANRLRETMEIERQAMPIAQKDYTPTERDLTEWEACMLVADRTRFIEKHGMTPEQWIEARDARH